MKRELTESVKLKFKKIGDDQHYQFFIDDRIHYWKYHQNGTTKMPMRKSVDPSVKNRNLMLKVIHGVVLHQIKKYKIFDKVTIKLPKATRSDLNG